MNGTLQRAHAIPAPGEHLCGIAWDGECLWHADAGTSLLYRLDAVDGRIVRTLACPDVRTCTSFADALLWQVAGRPKSVRCLDPDSGNVVREIPLRSETACGLEVGQDHFWTTFEEGSLALCRLSDGAIEREFAAEPRIAGVTGLFGDLWYAVDEPGLIVRVAPDTGSEAGRYRIDGSPTGLSSDGHRLWYADFSSKQLVAVVPP